MSMKKSQLPTLIGASLLAATVAPVVVADGHKPTRTVVYLTRHAEKLTVQKAEGGDNCALDAKGKNRCEEALNALGDKRAELLAEWFENRGIIDEVTHVISSDKQRTRQTVEPTAQKVIDRHGGIDVAGVDIELHGHFHGQQTDLLASDIEDGLQDGVMQIPALDANSENNELTSNGKSVDPMAAAILGLPAGSVAIVAAHSGTIYKILGGDDTDGNPATGDDETVGLGIDTTIGDNFANVTLFPKKESDGKVVDFGDLWKIVINNNTGQARVAWRKNLQPQRLQLENQTTNRRGQLQNRFW